MKKIKPVPSETEKVENDFAILNMVRQADLDNVGSSTNVETCNGHEHSLSTKTPKVPEHATGRKRKTDETTPAPVSKRSSSSSAHGKPRLSTTTLNASRRVSGENSPEENLRLDAEINPDTDSETMERIMVKDLLVSSLKQKFKGSESHHNDESNKHDDYDMKSPDDLEQNEKTLSNNSKSPTCFSKKTKRKRVAGLTKCAMKRGEIDSEDLIGCRIKIWWPTDKKYYGGTIKSYDSLKRKHVILYEDGDVEILRLEKERWELLDKGRKSTKKIKRSSLETSGHKLKGSSGSPSKKKKKIVNGKQSPSKPAKPRKKYASKSDFYQEQAKETSEISNPEETMISKADETDSGGSEEELTAVHNEITKKGKKSNKKVRSVPRGKRLKKTKNFHHIEESDDDKRDYNERISEDRESVPQYSSEEKKVDESSERESVHGEEESESEGEQDNSDVGDSPGETERSHIEPSSPDDVSIAEISDNIPLIKWNCRKGKKSSGKVR